MRSRRSTPILAAAGVAAGILATRLFPRANYNFRGKTVFITGGSRGLGLVLAREFASRGVRVVISARDGDALRRAEADLRQITNDVLALETDITMREEAEAAVAEIRKKLGGIDVLVNNAGTICVGPLDVMTIDDFRESINTHFWGPYFTTMAVLGHMRERGQGRIINISSIGGKISVPHLLPYCVGKFALTGFSEGLRSALLKENIYVTTVCPGLMRTGSPRNAKFKGNNEAEYAWFSISDSLPMLSMSAQRAAQMILRACAYGDSEVILSLPAKLAVNFEAILPGLTSDLLAIADSLLPSAAGTDRQAKTGKESKSKLSPSWLTALNERAAQVNNQVP